MSRFQIALIGCLLFAAGLWFAAEAAAVSSAWRVVGILLLVGLGIVAAAAIGALSDVADAIRHHGKRVQNHQKSSTKKSTPPQKSTPS